jgi:nitrite reductase/ring-hydroxylating ferredoxin subunit
MPHRLLPPGNLAPVRLLAKFDAIDGPAGKVGKLAREVFKPRPVKDVLSGSWLGHPLHPVLTDVAIGSWTSAVLLDWLGGRDARPAARRLIGLGLLSVPAVASSGLSDWGDSEIGDPEVRRIGIVHAATNVLAATLFAASWAQRRNGGGRATALAGATAMGAAAYLGGHLSFGEGVGVDQTVFEDEPEEWTDVIAEADLATEDTRCVLAAGTPVLLVRTGGELYALSDHCSHRGGPLHEGEIQDGTVTCPWHHSVFALADGALIHGPAAYPQPAWDVRARAGRIEVRRR